MRTAWQPVFALAPFGLVVFVGAATLIDLD